MSVLGAIGAGVGIASGVTAIGKSLGIGGKKRDKRQLNQQKELNEQAGEVNYRYGEMAAQNSFQRTNEFYDKLFADNTPAAQKQRLKDAGLSPALMYGGAGGTGGASVSPQAQGATGGVQAGQAANSAEQMMQSNQAMAMGLQLSRLKSEIEVNESVADKNKAEADKAGAQTQTENEQRNAFIAKLHEEGRTAWLENAMRDFKMERSERSKNEYVATSNEYGATWIARDGYFEQETAAEIAKIWGEANNNEALAELNTEKKQGYWQELLNATISAKADEARAAAAKLSAEWETGEYTNWKTWTEVAKGVVNSVTSAVSAGAKASGAKNLKNLKK